MRLKAQEKKVDHMERAKRTEEIPMLKTQHEVSFSIIVNYFIILPADRF